MSIATIAQSHRTAFALKVSAPVIPLRIGIASVWTNVVPAILGLYRSEVFIETKCTNETAGIGCIATRS